MNLPSVKTLSRLFPPGFSEDNAALAKRARVILETDIKKLRQEVPASMNFGKGALRLDLIDSLMRAHGVESCQLADTLGTSARDYADYVNTGEMYATTLIRDENGRYTVESLGDFIERKERAGVRFA